MQTGWPIGQPVCLVGVARKSSAAALCLVTIVIFGQDVGHVYRPTITSIIRVAIQAGAIREYLVESDLMTTADALSESAEMYLKTVFELSDGEAFVPISSAAERLGVSAISATEMFHRMQSDGLIDHAPYRGVRLTKDGRANARAILRRHRLWERFLYDRLGIGWTEVHDLACRLEHAVGVEVTEPLAAALGDPETCPHGNPIPADGRTPAEDSLIQLDQLETGSSAMVVRIRPETTEVLSYLEARRLIPGTWVALEEREPLGNALVLHVGETNVVMSESLASRIVVQPSGMSGP